MEDNPYQPSRPVTDNSPAKRSRKRSDRSWTPVIVCLATAWLLPLGSFTLSIFALQLEPFVIEEVIDVLPFALLTLSLTLVTAASLLAPKHGAMVLLAGIAGFAFELALFGAIAVGFLRGVV